MIMHRCEARAGASSSTDPNHTHFGKWGRIIDTDAVTRSWLVAIEAAGYLSRHRSAMRTRPSG